MKIKHVFVTAAFSLALGLGVIGLVNHQGKVVEEARADAAESGTISVDLTGENWASNAEGQNISILFSDGTNEGWGTLEFAAQYQYVVFVDYSLNFTPTTMKAYRYNPYYGKEAGQWDIDPKGELDGHEWGVWNIGEELSYEPNSNIVIAGTGYSFVGYAYLEGKGSSTGWDWKTFADLTGVKLNGSNHVEYYITMEFNKWDEFGAKIFNSFYGWDSCTFSKYVDTSNDLWVKNGNNIQYTGDDPVTLSVYFDRNNGSIYITDPIPAAADEWAEYFLGVTGSSNTCAFSKEKWGTAASLYKTLDPQVKALFDAIDYIADPKTETGTYLEAAVLRYDYVLVLYGVDESNTEAKGFEDFMNRVETKHLPINESSNLIISSNSDMTLIITVVSSVSLIAVASFFMLKKKKESK